ncbi:MAG: hypothetical protein ACREV2_01435 [Burkholderiales bacterium]
MNDFSRRIADLSAKKCDMHREELARIADELESSDIATSTVNIAKCRDRYEN